MKPFIMLILTSTFLIYVNALRSKADIHRSQPSSQKQTRYQECLDKGIASGKSADQALCSDLDSLQIELDKIGIERYFEEIKGFTSTLEAYVNETGFNYYHFEGSRYFLERTLSHLTFIANKFQNTREIIAPLKYAANLFKTMSESSRLMADPILSEKDGRDIIYKFIHLNIKLLILQDSADALVQMPSDSNRLIFGYVQDLVLWKSQYDSLTKPSVLMTVILYDQTRKARHSLDQLRQKFEASLFSVFGSDRFIHFEPDV